MARDVTEDEPLFIDIANRISKRRTDLNGLFPGRFTQVKCSQMMNQIGRTLFNDEWGDKQGDKFFFDEDLGKRWSEMETGHSAKYKNPHVLIAIAKVLQCSTDYLLTGKDSPSVRDICSVLSYLAFAYPMEIMDMGDKSIGVGVRFAPVAMGRLYPQLDEFRGENDFPTDEIIKFLHGLKSAMETDKREEPCFPPEPLCGHPLSRQAAADVFMLLNNTSTANPTDKRRYEYNRLQGMNNDGNLPPEKAEIAKSAIN